MAAALVISGGLLADDAIGVGIADDVLTFPVAAAYAADKLNPLTGGSDGYPRPWSTTKPDLTNVFNGARGNEAHNKDNFDPERIPPWLKASVGGAIGAIWLRQNLMEFKEEKIG